MTVRPPSAPVTRTGAASWNGSVAFPAWLTSYTSANTVMSAAPLTRIRTVAEPVCCRGAASGAEVNAALSPGMGRLRPPAARPGSPEMDGGAPPGGLTMVCAGPRSRTAVCLVPARPG